MQSRFRMRGTILSFFVLLLIIVAVIAIPPRPATFYGKINSGTAPEGLLVEGKIDGITYASTYSVRLSDTLVYYNIEIPGDDPDTSEKDGGSSGDLIEFYVEGNKADQTEAWGEGKAMLLDLTVDLSSLDCETDDDCNYLDDSYCSGFQLVIEEGVCDAGSCIVESSQACDFGCGAECIDSCADTECDVLDECVGTDFYDYSDVPNSCNGCLCSHNSCGAPTIIEDDYRCRFSHTGKDFGENPFSGLSAPWS